MVRAGISLITLLLLANPASAADPQAFPVPPSERSAAVREAVFAAHVFEGDQARAAGKLVAAANAYADALDVHEDPVVAGRLGVLLVKLHKPTDAADLLLEGIERGFEGVSKEERKSFLDAYDTARAEVTWLNITISVAGAKLTLDGEPKNEKGYSAFTLFVMPGEHELRASLEGYEDAVVTFHGFKGRENSVTLTLKPLRPMNVNPDVLRRHVMNRREDREIQRNAEDPPEDVPEKRVVVGGVEGGPQPEKTRMSVEGGPVVVFGVATWAPAVGAVAGVRWRLKEYFSLGVEGRGAWLTSGIEGRQINAMTAGGLASGCLHWRWVYGCAIGHLGGITIRMERGSYKPQSNTYFMPGFGGRIGARLYLRGGFVLGASFDAMGLNRGIKVLAGQTELVNHPPIMLGTQVVGAWEF